MCIIGKLNRNYRVACFAHLWACMWQIRVHTSDIKGAGTDANVFITLHGRDGDSGKRVLVAKGGADFERGKVDEFELTGRKIGQLERIRVGLDNSGPRASWHCKMVEVLCPGAEWVRFPCNRWLSTKEEDGPIERDLYPDGSDLALKGDVHFEPYAFQNDAHIIKESEL
eukprot:scaffold34498_cov47-Prasinocladus_malaysianus.AAC.1